MEIKNQMGHKKFGRIFVVVYDSAGVGHDSRDEEFGDKGANTIGHVIERTGIDLPNMNLIGLSSIALDKGKATKGYAARLNSAGNAKDTLAGHWEMMGVKTIIPFPTFTNNGFPKDMVVELEKAFGKKILGNKAASGTEIIDEFGEDEINGKGIIVYTSADSVLQICANEETTGLDELYRMCKEARRICSSKPEWNVGRIIARPYIGKSKGNFKRTANRHDYTVAPFHKTLLKDLFDAKYATISIGKIYDIFNHEGLSEQYPIKSNLDGLQMIEKFIKTKEFTGLCFANLVDFDSSFGHRRDIDGYGKALLEADEYIGKFMKAMRKDDLLMISADHGNDPTFPGSDHTRENTPLLIYSKSFKGAATFPTMQSFAVIGKTILDNFNVKPTVDEIGKSILDLII